MCVYVRACMCVCVHVCEWETVNMLHYLVLLTQSLDLSLVSAARRKVETLHTIYRSQIPVCLQHSRVTITSSCITQTCSDKSSRLAKLLKHIISQLLSKLSTVLF